MLGRSTSRVSLAVVAGLGFTALALAGTGTVAVSASPTSEALRVEVRPPPTLAGTLMIKSVGKSASPLDSEAMQDLATYSVQADMDFDTVVAAHRGINEFSAYISDLEHRRPDLFVRAGIPSPGKSADYWIQVTKIPDTAELLLIQQLPVDVELRYGAPASSAELATLAEVLIMHLAEAPDLIRSAGTTYDSAEDVLRVAYAPTAGASELAVSTTLAEAISAAAASFPNGMLPLTVRLELDAGRTGVTETMVQGGRNLNLGGAVECTAGFTAKRNDNRGVLTARHCANALTYNSEDGVISQDPARLSTTL